MNNQTTRSSRSVLLRFTKATFMAGLLPTLVLMFSLQTSQAGSATWNLNPTSGDWNTAANWTPATVPNGLSDTATFQVSNQTNISDLSDVTLDSAVFSPGASAFTIGVSVVLGMNLHASLTFEGSGVSNNSEVTQTFVQTSSVQASPAISFKNTASAGTDILFITNGAANNVTSGGRTTFFNASTAASASFINNPSGVGIGGNLQFYDSATADQASVTNVGNPFSVYIAGFTEFHNTSTAGNGTFLNQGPGYEGGFMRFWDEASAANGTFTSEGSSEPSGVGASIEFHGSSTAGNAIFTNSGSDWERGYSKIQFMDSSNADNSMITLIGGNRSGGQVEFSDESSASNSVLIANGRANAGGKILFLDDSTGGTVRVEVFGNNGGGTLDISGHDLPGVTVGSIEGDGFITLGDNNLTVGTNQLGTLFSGTIQDNGSLTKIGTGNLTLTGSNTYTGGTVVESGVLLANNSSGSGTGGGPVNVNAGTFGGRGAVSGNVRVGTGSGAGAILAPGERGVTPGRFTIRRKLTLNADASYVVLFDSSVPTADQVRCKGVVIRGAQIQFSDRASTVLPAGTVFTVIDNKAAKPISGTFSNLTDGAIVTIGSNTFQANYEGGDGNDLTLTVL